MSAAPRAPAAEDVNAAYYATLSPGREDYWRRMAAPRHRLAVFLRLLGEDPPGSLVDLGCGGGHLLLEIAGRHPRARLSGIDLSAAQIEANRAALPAIAWRALDLSGASPVPDDMAGAFDVVVASEIIEHVADPAAFLRAAARLAAPARGRLLLSTQSGPVRETERRVGHLRHYSAAEMAGLLRGSGWAPVRVWNSGFPFHDLSKWWANRDPDAAMRRFGEGPYGPAEKLVCWALRGAFLLNSRRRGAQLFAVARRAGAAAAAGGGA